MSPAASRLTPADDETLAQFLRRVMDARGVSVEQLALRLATRNGETKDEKTLGRQVKAWRSGRRPLSISDDNAASLARELNADFTPFVRRPVRHDDVLTRVLKELRELRERVGVLEARLPQDG